MKKKTTARATAEPRKILVVDIGGSKIKMMHTGAAEPIKVRSGTTMTPAKLVDKVREAVADKDYEAVSIGYPGLVGPQGPRSEPANLGAGWVGFDFAAAFARPVRIINDAAMQALGSYEGGRMLFLGLGTGLGSTFVAENVVVPLELGRLFFQKGRTLGEALGADGLQRLGKRGWRLVVQRAVASLTDVFQADYVVLGGGNAKLIKELPAGARLGHNSTVFRGGYRLWNFEHVPTLSEEVGHIDPRPNGGKWRML
jgi:predicted NBD/HSP70 family sugar kinase